MSHKHCCNNRCGNAYYGYSGYGGNRANSGFGGFGGLLIPLLLVGLISNRRRFF